MWKWISGTIAVGLLFTVWSTYDGLVFRDEQVLQTYSQVQNQMQRQADLIPNLVETVKGSAAFEGKTLTQVMEARSKLTAVAKLDPRELADNPELQKQLVEAQRASQQAMLSINAVKEAYPTLQSVALFASLMTQIEGSQNRVSVARRYNQVAVQDFNQHVRAFPNNIIARQIGFSAKPYFQADDDAKVAPKVKF